MKLSKKKQILFSVSVVLVIFTVSIFWGASHALVKFQPPTQGNWVISGLEIIDYDVIINGSVTVQVSGELRITGANVLFKANKTHNYELKIDGTLIIENSNVSVTNSNYNFTLTGSGGSQISITDSRIEYAFIYVTNAQVTIDNSIFYGCLDYTLYYMAEVIITNNRFENAELGLFILDCDTATIFNNTFVLVENGLHIEGADNATIEENDFINIASTGIYLDTVQITNVTSNNFSSVITGIYVEDKRINLFSNNFVDNEVAVVLDNADNSYAELNNFTSVTDVCIEASLTKNTVFTENNFIDSEMGFDLFASGLTITHNVFNRTNEAIISFDSDDITVQSNSFLNIPVIGVEITDSWDAIVLDNEFYNVTVGINLIGGRRCTVQGNNLFDVDEGIGIITSREMEILGNTIEKTITGIYLEQTKDAVVTANGAIEATYGISLWSMSDVTLASNGVFDSVYGISIWFSEKVRLLGNEVNTSDIGIIARSSLQLEIKDGDLRALNNGIQILGSTNPTISGNTFDNITNEAIILKDSNNFLVYQNNFLEVGSYATIDNCIGYFEREVNNVTSIGNYYQDHNTSDPVFIDTVTIGALVIDIYDNNPLQKEYAVKPTIEFVSREILEPTDVDDVLLETQIFVPTGVDLTVLIQFEVTNQVGWNEIDITTSGEPVGQIGAINRYIGTIPAYPYDYVITYRVQVQYDEDGSPVTVTTENDTYTVSTSDFTPIIIYTPEVHVITFIDDVEATVVTNNFYEDQEYIIFVEIDNRTDMDTIEGNRHVNLTWTEINSLTNDTESFNAVMLYNSTTDVYYMPFGRGYDAGFLINYYIAVVDVNGTIYRTVFNYTIIIESPPGDTGFNAITLLSIGGTLLAVQAIVIFRRRRRRNDE